MRVARFGERAGRRGLWPEDSPRPVPGHGECRIAIDACGICGSDLSRARSIVEGRGEQEGVVPGHEFVGRVIELGPGADAVGAGVGDLVVVNPIIERNGNVHVIGYHRDGGFAEEVVVPSWAALPTSLAPGVDLRLLALAEPLAVAIHAGGRAAEGRDGALVIGDGTVGVLLCHVLGGLGHRRIVLSGRHGPRLKIGLEMGADEVFGADEAIAGAFDTVFVAAPGPESIGEAMAALRHGGRLVQLGYPLAGSPAMDDDALERLVRAEISMAGSFAYTADEFAEAVSRIASGTVSVSPVVDRVITLEEIGDRGVHDLLERRVDGCKILVVPGHGG